MFARVLVLLLLSLCVTSLGLMANEPPEALLKKAKSGDEEAMIEVLQFYQRSYKTDEQAYDDIIKWGSRLADVGQVDGLSILAGHYYFIAIAEGVKEGLFLKDTSSIDEIKNAVAEAKLSDDFQKPGTDEHMARAVKSKHMIKCIDYMQQAAKLGDNTSLILLSMLYENGWYFEKDYEKALYFMRKVVDSGRPDSFVAMAKFFERNNKVEEALDYYQQAAELNEPAALYWIATQCYDGTLIEKDPKRGDGLMRAAALRNYPSAQAFLVIHNVRKEISNHVAEAYGWYLVLSDKDPEKAHQFEPIFEELDVTYIELGEAYAKQFRKEIQVNLAAQKNLQN